VNPSLTDRIHPLREPLEDALPNSEDNIAEDLLAISTIEDEDDEDGMEYPVLRISREDPLPEAPLPIITVDPDVHDLDEDDEDEDDDSDGDSDDEDEDDDSDDSAIEVSSVRPSLSQTGAAKSPLVQKDIVPIASPITTRSQSKQTVERPVTRSTSKATPKKAAPAPSKRPSTSLYKITLEDPVETPSTTTKASRGRSTTVKGNSKGKGRAKPTPSNDLSPPPTLPTGNIDTLNRLRAEYSSLAASQVHQMRANLTNLRPVSLLSIFRSKFSS